MIILPSLSYLNITVFIAFVFGSIVGSFLNVCIYRLPRGESIILPPSHCPRCQKKIAWYDNLPLLSYFLLKRKCRYCQGTISFRYLLVELLTGAIFAYFFFNWGFSPEFFIYIFFTSSLTIATFTDFDHRIIPNTVTYPALFLGIGLSTLYPSLQRNIWQWSKLCTTPGEGLLASLAGTLSGGIFLYLIGIFGKTAVNMFGKNKLKEEVFKKGTVMGGGDIKLLAMIGAFLGWQLAALTIFISALSGSVAGIFVKIQKGESYIPYGPYLALGAAIGLLWGGQLINWYLHSIGG